MMPHRKKRLHLAGRRVSQLDISLLKPSLVTVDLSFNSLSGFPEELCSLPNIEFLDLRRNRIAEIPGSIANLTRLIHLQLDENCLTQIPQGVLHPLKSLVKLGLSQNLLDYFPDIQGLHPSQGGSLLFVFISHNPVSYMRVLSPLSTESMALPPCDHLEGVEKHPDRIIPHNAPWLFLPSWEPIDCTLGREELPQQLLPNLFISSEKAARNPSLLSWLRIDAVVRIMESYDESMYPPAIAIHFAPLSDTPGSQLAPCLASALAFLDSQRHQGRRVLVHCKMGISRSAAVAIAYVMRLQSVSLREASFFVKQRHPCKPNSGFLNQLRDFEKGIGTNMEGTNTFGCVMPRDSCSAAET